MGYGQQQPMGYGQQPQMGYGQVRRFSSLLPLSQVSMEVVRAGKDDDDDDDERLSGWRVRGVADNQLFPDKTPETASASLRPTSEARRNG